jgi:lipopolysaccharide transport system ATP-binding protein
VNVIEVKGLSKKYRIGKAEKRADTILGAIANGLKSPLQNLRQIRNLSKLDRDEDSVFWALRDVSFEVKQGEVLGIIGHNGAGKSTLLKILSRITEPSAGEVRITGRVAALLEVGTGFHPELTGRENIYMNGTILGMRKREIDTKLDEIVDFSGVEKYLDTPVKFYSSGMRVRLGFSVAAHLEPEILIVDEVLAVGDAEFQRKCLGKMQDVSSNYGRTVLFVSHNMAAVRKLCSSLLVIKSGEIAFRGETTNGISAYNNQFNAIGLQSDLINRVDRVGSGEVKFKSVYLRDWKGDKIISNTFSTGDSIRIVCEIDSSGDFDNVSFLITCRDIDDEPLFTLHTRLTEKLFSIRKGINIVNCDVAKFPLVKGEYYLSLRGICGGKTTKLGNVTDHIEKALFFRVEDGDFYGSGEQLNSEKAGIINVLHNWS